MAASGSCFLCNAAYSPVWRRDKATGQTICNRCYRNPAPAPEPSLDALSAENLFDDNGEFALSLAEDQPSNGSTEDRTRKKRKHRERGLSEGGEGAGELAPPAELDLSTPAVESDTEYPAVDLDTAPRKLQVQSSGSSKLDGSYWRMAGPSRGKPCYAKWTEKKPMYLFWNRKWFIGWDFGSAKSYAQLKDAGLLCPCEPYPKVWKVLDKHERKEKPGGVDDDPAKGKRQYSDNLAMRVIDAAVLEFAVESGVLDSVLPSQEAKATRRSKHEAARTRPDKSAASTEKVPAPASETKTLTAEEKAEQDALNAASSSEEERPAGVPAEASDEDSASDSSSEESSSSASASARPPSAERGQEQRPLEARQANPAQSMESKLKAELLKVSNPLARQQKFRTVRDMLLKKANGVAGMTPENLQAVLRGIENWLVQSAWTQPAAAPAKAGAAPAKAGAAPAKAGAPRPAPAPPLPADVAPVRSALRRPGAPRQHDRRINFKDSSSMVKEVFVESHRALGELRSMKSSDVWPTAQKAMPRFQARTFFTLVAIPLGLAGLFLYVLAHDLYSPRVEQYCWQVEQGGRGQRALHWMGGFVHWLSIDQQDPLPRHPHCRMVPDPEGLIIYFIVLPPTWVMIVISSWVTRRLRRDKGVIRSLLEKIYEALEEGPWPAPQGYLGEVPRNEQTLAFLRALEKDGLRTKYQHMLYALGLQVIMFLFDYFVKGYTLRWIVWYQVLWLSFSSTIVQVRPLVKFSAYLSRTLVDLYIELLRHRQGSWLQLLAWHTELELDVLRLWGKVNLHAVMPSVPFFSLALVHSLADQDGTSGTIVASFLLILGGLALVAMLQPIARISTMFNSSLAFKAVPKLVKGEEAVLRRPGHMSIVAVARSMALELPTRSATEDQQYTTYLEYVQGAKMSLALGVPGYLMVPISSSNVSGMFTAFLLKFPMFVSLFMAARQHVKTAEDHVGHIPRLR